MPFDLETGNAEANRRFPNSRPLGNKAGFLSDDGYKEGGSSAIFFSVAHARVHGQSMDIHRGRYSAPNARPREKEYRDVDAMTEFITGVGYHMLFRTLVSNIMFEL